MRADRIGFLLCRLIAVGMVLWNLPGFLRELVYYSNSLDPGDAATRRLGLLPGVVMLCAAVAIWAMARGASRWFVGDENKGTSLSIDGAQFAAIGLALMGVAAFAYSAGDLAPVVAHVLNPNFQHATPVNMLFDGGNSDAPTLAIVGLLLLAFAPRLGIWLEQASLPKEEGPSDAA